MTPVSEEEKQPNSTPAPTVGAAGPVATQKPGLEAMLVEALLADRKAERRSRNIKTFLIAGFAFGYLGLMSLTYVSNQEESLPSGSYASLVKMTGEIGPGKPISIENLGEPLVRAFSDKGSKGVVIQMNSPGGTPVQSLLVNQKLTELSRKYNKEVIVVTEDVVASGGYLIAVAADKIYVSSSSLVGSIGVVSRRFGYTGLMEKLGVESRTITSGESKNLGDPFKPRDPADDKFLGSLMTEIHNDFIETVKAGRGDRLDYSAEGLFSGKVWTGRQAQAIGLVDHIGSMSEAVQAEFGVNKLREYKKKESLLSNILSGIATKATHTLTELQTQAPVELKWSPAQ